MKGKWGGARKGSGPKLNPAKALRLGEACALRILAKISHEKQLVKLYETCQDARLKALIIFRLMEFGYGKPTQTQEVTGKDGGPISVIIETNVKMRDPHE